MSLCPFPGCQAVSPGRNGVFCADHHFIIEPAYRRLILRTKIAIARSASDSDRAHLGEQLNGYVSSAVRRVLKEGPHAA